MTACPWKINGAKATLLEANASIQLDAPASGVNGLAGKDATFLGVAPGGAGCPPLALSDAYVRGADLVALYRPVDGFPFDTEIYWRVEKATGAELRMSLLVSVETDLLDTRPELIIESNALRGTLSTLGVDEASPSILDATDKAEAADVVCVSEVARGMRWMEAVHPSDRGEAALELIEGEDAPPHWRWRLFSRFLEKGVIRRARLAVALLTHDGADTSEFYNDFARQPPPLTV